MIGNPVSFSRQVFSLLAITSSQAQNYVKPCRRAALPLSNAARDLQPQACRTTLGLLHLLRNDTPQHLDSPLNQA
ncbi:hypothetical protein BKA66DRAFT_468103 [Pyrenochaeta sp. MPI-SDFR-AT-0127]|nr:hypothetical protein BKA66DRAFT_468103 [Pyrenochaeta sp. MPI-SDFR-AT-0127]